MGRACVELALLGLCFAAVAEASGIYFPGQLNHAEHESCRTHLSTDGTCERTCGPSFNPRELSKCGIKDSAFLYCCDPNLVRTTDRVVDISPPFTTFQCGKNSRNSFFFPPFYDPPAGFLRPEADLPSHDVLTAAIPPSHTPGIPEEAIVEYEDFTSPPGIYEAVGGVVAEKNAWPWMALVGKNTTQAPKWFCGGVLINEQWVLSAYHCFIHHFAEVVRLGEHDYNDEYEGASPKDFDVLETVLYPDYKHPQAYHDIALLKLASKVTIEDYIRPVCLPWGRASDSVVTNNIATLTGWGDTEYGGFPSTILQEVNVTVFDVGQCDSSYSSLPHYSVTWPQGIGEETLCAGDPNGGRDACQGDSGGPLVSQDENGSYVLAGIVSRGYGCGHKDYPGLYANMRHPAYLAWIKKTAFTSP
ncbi:hypothetical protein O3P69_010078 [Scylla paramamosain]|uniref:limulus clotting factor C n=1 Tax=Scylla paramamosain TaxID=85552 RepID=A0AAW0SPH8_SCYPA